MFIPNYIGYPAAAHAGRSHPEQHIARNQRRGPSRGVWRCSRRRSAKRGRNHCRQPSRQLSRPQHGRKRQRRAQQPQPSADPAHTRKGIRKPGQHGNARITVRNLHVVRVDSVNNLLLVRGAVPGPNGGFLTVRQTNKV